VSSSRAEQLEVQTRGSGYEQKPLVKRWTVNHKSALVIDIFKGKTRAVGARLAKSAWITGACLSCDQPVDAPL
jgi:hypothetical protein